EKYNGEGYPYGLKGDEIPICAAIVSVVDVYDALRSERPYKRAFSHEEAINIILNGDNRTNPQHFNPEVLNILKKYENDIKDLWDIINKRSSKLLILIKNIEKQKKNRT
ncbi:HD-GYP domain-containing protein, partial [Marinitoga sp. 1155]|uniref:HD-GYP domain-containing protein n=2 Tax=unclassified Marinitoga TaxID=2640159 RepID=UPI0006586F1B